MSAGLFKAWRSDRALVMPYVLALFAFPLIYYITHSHAEYRHPIDTIIVVLVVYGASGLVRRRSRLDTAKKNRAVLSPQGS
jgi:hypothetical protein